MRIQRPYWFIGGAAIAMVGALLLGIALRPLAPQWQWYLGIMRPSREEEQQQGNSTSMMPVPDGSVRQKQEMMEEIGKASERIATRGIQVKEEARTATTSFAAPPSASSYQLSIPSIGVHMDIVVGEESAERGLWKGAWLIPGSSTPVHGGNTVLSAHRYLRTSGEKTFYHLDKLVEGDEIVVAWKGNEFRYRVFEKDIVPATEVSIVDNTPDAILTLFTCDPPYSTKNRLYIKARLVQ